MLGWSIDQFWIVHELPLNAGFNEPAKIVDSEGLAVKRVLQHLLNQITLGIVVSLLLINVPTCQRDVVLNGAVGSEVHKVEILSPITNLAGIPATEVVEKAIRVLDKRPDSLPGADRLLHVCLGRVMILEIGRYGKDRAEEWAHTDVLHGGIEILHVDFASASFEISMVGKSVDDGARAPAFVFKCLCVFSDSQGGRHFDKRAKKDLLR
jgi:hypothetical protein